MFGERLKKLRSIHNLSQTELGNLLGKGNANISNWEKGISKPDYDTIKKIANFFNVSTDYLYGSEENTAINKINQILREENILKPDETIDETELKIAIEQVRQYKNVYKNNINDEDII